MAIAEVVITGISAIASTLLSGAMQSNIIDRGEAASKDQYLGELSESRRRFNVETGLSRQQLSEQKRQFNKSFDLKREELDMTKNEYARNAFRDQVKNLTNYLDKDEALKNLYINRLNGLRN